MRVLFLDIDGVLNSARSAVGLGGYPMELSQRGLFDQVAIGLIRRMCQAGGISICLSSVWRLYNTPQEVADGLELPVIDRTPKLVGPRGREIAHWLSEHPEVTEYAIVDDDADMLEEQRPRFVKTHGWEGLTWECFCKLCELFGVSPHDGMNVRERDWGRGRLDWSDADADAALPPDPEVDVLITRSEHGHAQSSACCAAALPPEGKETP